MRFVLYSAITVFCCMFVSERNREEDMDRFLDLGLCVIAGVSTCKLAEKL